jgi:DNA-binding beta-propeller fold protein YncE
MRAGIVLRLALAGLAGALPIVAGVALRGPAPGAGAAGADPVGVAVNPNTNFIYVANSYISNNVRFSR